MESDNENVPYVELELDIRDVRAIFQSISGTLDTFTDTEDEPEEYETRLVALEDFLRRVILEYNFKVESTEE
jgi:hypothetical protein|tara:strand:- start:434 stop:649 length:216 start_codon:yes stop_codon:yes gene_type:complete